MCQVKIYNNILEVMTSHVLKKVEKYTNMINSYELNKFVFRYNTVSIHTKIDDVNSKAENFSPKYLLNQKHVSTIFHYRRRI